MRTETQRGRTSSAPPPARSRTNIPTSCILYSPVRGTWPGRHSSQRLSTAGRGGGGPCAREANSFGRRSAVGAQKGDATRASRDSSGTVPAAATRQSAACLRVAQRINRPWASPWASPWSLSRSSPWSSLGCRRGRATVGRRSAQGANWLRGRRVARSVAAGRRVGRIPVRD
jgi:hypothetical protein